ncbi:unnamed protein product [Dibothriocephalus latus]|uniref:FAD/NAD(P)-binding domain-containing protein n=1 Tax=Dibothriocephalus latus TaxID=60516 RepID=A0A3P6PH98_DIBLA|nr:unnamed protein product [Dibothriocephalus latus]
MCISTLASLQIKKKESVGGENHELDQYEVSGVFQNESKQVFVEDFDTNTPSAPPPLNLSQCHPSRCLFRLQVIFAIGRDPCTTSMGLSNVGVKLTNSHYVETDEEERTNIANIYALGDINANGLKLTPVAIQTGKLLARRLYAADDCLVSNLCPYLYSVRLTRLSSPRALWCCRGIPIYRFLLILLGLLNLYPQRCYAKHRHPPILPNVPRNFLLRREACAENPLCAFPSSFLPYECSPDVDVQLPLHHTHTIKPPSIVFCQRFR